MLALANSFIISLIAFGPSTIKNYRIIFPKMYCIQFISVIYCTKSIAHNHFKRKDVYI